MAVLEAWAYAKPVIMTPQCNLPGGFNASAAIRIDTSPSGIAAGLRAILEMSDSQRQYMGQRGFELVKARYSWTEVARQMQTVQDWVVGIGPVPECVEIVEEGKRHAI